MIEKDYYSILGVVNMLRMGNMDDINIQGKKEMGGGILFQICHFPLNVESF